MLSHGDYVNGRTRLVEDAALLFWGEWEPPSHVEDLTESGDGRRPRWLHRPYLPGRMPAQPKNCGAACSTPPGCDSTCGPGGVCQNTDPYVFDGEFKYLLCKQSTHRGKRATDMARLDVGSVILFGSNARVSGKWVFELDTVLVVGSHTDYRPSQWSRELTGRTFLDHAD